MLEMIYRTLLDGAVVGLPYSLTFLGVWLVFRLQDDFDLTVDGSFTLGGATSAVLILLGVNPWLALLGACVVGSVAGLLTHVLKNALSLSLVLTSITVSLGLYSVSLWLMGQPNLSLVGASTVFTQWHELWGGSGFVPTELVIALSAIIVLAVFGAFAVFLRSEAGLALRASGLNPSMARSMGISPRRMLMVCIVLGNLLAAAGGGLVAQQQGFADVTMGVGVILFGVTAVLLGEIVFGFKRGVLWMLFGVLVGALLYRFLLAGAFRIGFPPQYLQGVTAILILTSIAIGRYSAVVSRRRMMRRWDTPDGAVTERAMR